MLASRQYIVSDKQQSREHEIFDLYGIIKLLWPGNSPDLNAIEPTWNWMKRETTGKGCPTGKAEMKGD